MKALILFPVIFFSIFIHSNLVAIEQSETITTPNEKLLNHSSDARYYTNLFSHLSHGMEHEYKEEIESKSHTGRVKKFHQTVKWEIIEAPHHFDKAPQYHFYLFGTVNGTMTDHTDLLGEIKYNYPIFLGVSDQSYLQLLYHPWEKHTDTSYSSLSSTSILTNPELRELQAIELLRIVCWQPIYDTKNHEHFPVEFYRGTRIDESLPMSMSQMLPIFEKKFLPDLIQLDNKNKISYIYSDGFHNYPSHSKIKFTTLREQASDHQFRWNFKHVIHPDWNQDAALKRFDYPGISRSIDETAFGLGQITFSDTPALFKSCEGTIYKFRTTYGWDQKSTSQDFMMSEENTYEYIKIKIDLKPNNALSSRTANCSKEEIEKKISSLEKEISNIDAEYEKKKDNRDSLLQDILILLYEKKDDCQGEFLELSNLLNKYRDEKNNKDNQILSDRKESLKLELAKLKLFIQS